ncbi:MAG: patatin-like phospholipase family protein [Clostridium sp.]|uniref:patatin-like phospholipase family protein n=1 Tax=Clostridium sp. TaxID=1506 RepID=UPI002A8C4434|nr:patatin-like phospholipase family protein [Clostridium sp.]MDY5096909.1 patatin-like phospholipase family protein [Clostridium sp.]
MTGLFLQGGGAKGAFQAGAIYAMYEKGMEFNVISGTSIGSINGYYVYTGNIEELKKYYTESDMATAIRSYRISDTIPNEYMIDELRKLKGVDPRVTAFYVNYVHVTGTSLNHVCKNLVNLDKEESLESIRYSSRLPFVCPEGEDSVDFERALELYDPQALAAKFGQRLQSGYYDKFDLDGGMMNNNFMEPFLKETVDKLYLLVLRNNFQIPQYLLDKYSEDQIVIIKRKEYFKPNDTLNCSSEFLNKLFKEGYETAKEII